MKGLTIRAAVLGLGLCGFLLPASTAATGGEQPAPRIWRDIQGREGKGVFVGIAVLLRKEDGTEYWVQIDQLCDADKELARQQLDARTPSRTKVKSPGVLSQKDQSDATSAPVGVQRLAPQTWHDDKGLELAGGFVGIGVLLRKEEGPEFCIPVDQLSTADRQFVRQQLASRYPAGKSADVASAVPRMEQAPAGQAREESASVSVKESPPPKSRSANVVESGPLAGADAPRVDRSPVHPPSSPGVASPTSPSEPTQNGDAVPRAPKKPRQERAGGNAPRVDVSPSPAALSAPANSLNWLSEAIIPNQKVTDSLQEIWAMQPDAATAQVSSLRAATSSASTQGRLAGALLIAVANERAGKRDIALGEYRQLAADGKGTAFGISASARVIVLEGQAVQEKLSALPATDAWLLMSDIWTWASTRPTTDVVLPAAKVQILFSWWKAIGCFVLGFVWLGLCGFIGRSLGGAGCIGAIIGLFWGCVMLFSEDGGITTWHSGHQCAFWLGLAVSVVLGLLVAAANAQNMPG